MNSNTCEGFLGWCLDGLKEARAKLSTYWNRPSRKQLQLEAIRDSLEENRRLMWQLDQLMALARQLDTIKETRK